MRILRLIRKIEKCGRGKRRGVGGGNRGGGWWLEEGHRDKDRNVTSLQTRTTKSLTVLRGQIIHFQGWNSQLRLMSTRTLNGRGLA